MLATNPEASSVSLKFPQYRENLTKHIGLSITHDACEVNTENWSPAIGAALSSYIRDTERCVVWGTKQKARGPVNRKSAWSRNDHHGYRLRIKLGEKEKLAERQVEITSLNAGLFRYTHQGCSKSSQFLPSSRNTSLKRPSPRNRAHPPPTSASVFPSAPGSTSDLAQQAAAMASSRLPPGALTLKQVTQVLPAPRPPAPAWSGVACDLLRHCP